MKPILNISTPFLFLSFLCVSVFWPLKNNAQSDLYPEMKLDYYNPKPLIINNIRVEGNSLVETPLIVIYTNLSMGQKISMPGTEIPQAIRNLWRQDLFSDVKVYIQDIGKKDTIDVVVAVTERVRLSRYSFPDLSRSKAKALSEETSLKGNMIVTEGLMNRTEREILSYYREKGFFNTKVTIQQAPDPDDLSKVIFRIYVDKGKKVKVYDFEFEGNENLSDKQLRKAFKKTTRKKNKINIFKSAKFIEEEYQEDKKNLKVLYGTYGFKDMKILSDELIQLSPARLLVRVRVQEGIQYKFRTIRFVGNAKYPNELLHRILDIDSGDVYNQTKLNDKLFASRDGLDISGLYMDDGYLFFNATPIVYNVEDDAIDLEIKIREGEQATIRNNFIVGNNKTSDHVILRELRTRPGQKFSRSDIQRTVRELSAMGLFDPQSIDVKPIPNFADGTVDIQYTLVEKASDQIELSGGIGPSWGGQGQQFVGTLGVVLNNFSTRKLTKRDLWNPLPSGDGQKLSVRGQSSGFFQSYNMSFTEPWLGGRKPNSLTVSLFHSLINGNLRPIGDVNRSTVRTTGASVSLGKRLRWPDDNFTILYSASVQRYKVQNGQVTQIFPFFNDGTSRTMEMKVVLGRNSLEGGFIFPTGGSNLALSIAGTPPFSLISGTDTRNLPPEKKYNWIEYHKWKFDAEWYVKPFTKTKFVFAAKSRTGIMGYYDQNIGFAPFERFRVGGSGLTGAMLFGQEIVSQRGYDEGEVSARATNQVNIGAPMFMKHTLELRYPVIDNPASTIYLLTFVEGGNAWNSFSTFNPFDLRRSAGGGVRLFLPMFGLIGLDWAYGFDWKSMNNTQPTQLHFYIGQQF